jgi:hypothetical protein
MRTRILYFMAAALAAVAAGTSAQSRLPPCPGSFATSKWSNCYGEAVAPNGARYAGEWLNDQFHGHGTNAYRDGAKYVGEYRDDKRNGQGIEYRADGSLLRSGTWENDVFVGSR